MVEGAVVVPYPKTLGEQVDLVAMMAAAGIPLAGGASVVVAEGEGAMNYALRLSAESAEVVGRWQQEGVEVRFGSPLMECVQRAIVGCRRRKCVVLTLCDGVVYAAYTNEKKLLYAEALPIASTEEFVNLLALLNRDYELRKARFVLLGKCSHQYYKTVKGYFRRVSREG